jgi:cupin 2 domain-containing protein
VITRLLDLPAEAPGEVTDVLARGGNVRIQRIVSRGQASAPGFWYDQDEHEWVVVLAGAARVRVEGREDLLELGPGDAVTLPAHLRHRVEWTHPDQATVWLSVFWR